jgi:hypothetical protein
MKIENTLFDVILFSSVFERDATEMEWGVNCWNPYQLFF